jgi:Ca-activated chloride channel homolog
MAELARAMDTARFSKEALYSSRKMSSRISAKEELNFDNLDAEASSISFLRRKTAQGKAQFDKTDDSQK